jgi:hypothetical protein
VYFGGDGIFTTPMHYMVTHPTSDSDTDLIGCHEPMTMGPGGDAPGNPRHLLGGNRPGSRPICLTLRCAEGCNGRLTDVGAHQLMGVGQSVREELGALSLDSRVTVRAFSTPFLRTVLSAQSFLTGYYGNHRLGTNISVGGCMDPFDFPSYRKEMDRLLEQDSRVLEEEEQVAGSKRAIHQALIKADVFSSDYPNVTWIALLETSVCLASHNMLPSSISEQDISFCSKQVMRRWKHLFDDPTFQELAISHFKAQIMRVSHETTGADETIPFTVYSAHDSTLYGLLHAFGAPTHLMEVNPPYASTLVFSTWKKEGEDCSIMQMTFNGESWWQLHENIIKNVAP